MSTPSGRRAATSCGLLSQGTDTERLNRLGILATFRIFLGHHSNQFNNLNSLSAALLLCFFQPALVSPQLSELTNSLANLKWGFRKRENELLGQLEQYKKMTTQLHLSQKKLRTTLR